MLLIKLTIFLLNLCLVLSRVVVSFLHPQNLKITSMAKFTPWLISSRNNSTSQLQESIRPKTISSRKTSCLMVFGVDLSTLMVRKWLTSKQICLINLLSKSFPFLQIPGIERTCKNLSKETRKKLKDSKRKWKMRKEETRNLELNLNLDFFVFFNFIFSFNETYWLILLL